MLKVAIATLLSILMATAGFTWGALHWTYSDGQRAGYVTSSPGDGSARRGNAGLWSQCRERSQTNLVHGARRRGC